MIKKSTESMMELTSSLTPISQHNETFDVNLPLETGVGITTKRVQDKQHPTKLQNRIEDLESAKSIAMSIAISSVEANPWQPRCTFNITDLVSSINEVGLVQPIIVRKHPSSIGKYQLVAGERRLRACTELGWCEIAAVEMANLADGDMAMFALTENVTRNDLSDFEVGVSLVAIQREFPSKKAMAEALGVSRAELYRLLSFASLPDFVQADLQAQPELLGSAAAEGILSVLKQHGVTAESKLAPLWAKLKQGTLGQLALVAKLRNEFKPMRAPTVAMDSTELFTGTKRIGRIKSDGKSFILHFKASAISKDQMQQLRDLATRFFP